MKINGTKMSDIDGGIYFDFTYGDNRCRGNIPLSVIASLLSGGRLKDNSNLAPGKKPILFKDFAVKNYLPHSKAQKKDKTYRADEQDVRMLSTFVGDTFLHLLNSQLRANIVEKRHIEQKISPNKVNRELSCLNQVLECAVELGYICRNPLSGLKRLPKRERKKYWLRKEQIDLVLSKLKGNVRDFFEFMILTGARLNEALIFRGQDILKHINDVQLFCEKKRKGKREEYRQIQIISLGSRFADLLSRLIPHPKTDFIFCNDNGNPLKERTVQKHIKKALVDSGLGDYVTEDARHTFAMHRAMVVKSFLQLQKELGHESQESTKWYLDESAKWNSSESIFYEILGKLSVVENVQKSSTESSKNKLSTSNFNENIKA